MHSFIPTLLCNIGNQTRSEKVCDTSRQVGPKGGYDNINWDAAAKLVWSDDLVLDNTLLCRMTITQ